MKKFDLYIPTFTYGFVRDGHNQTHTEKLENNPRIIDLKNDKTCLYNQITGEIIYVK